MLNITKKHIILFFSSLVLVLPIVNGLHFVLVDHSISNDLDTKKTTHFCDDFIQHQIYVFEIESTEINAPNWITTNLPIQVVYQINYHFDFSIDLNNKGPPASTLLIETA